MKRMAWLGMALVALAAGMASAGDLAVSAYWQDHMVLQRGKPITVWGKDAPGRVVTISFTNQTATATTDSDGFWETTFAQPFALSAAPQTLTITDDANESITLSDVLVGDVFLAAGQSNMDRRLKDSGKSFDEPQSIKDFCRDDDGIRFIRIARSAENPSGQEQLFDLPPIKPVNDKIGYYGEGYDWSPATGTNRNFVSSVALNFARYVRDANAAQGQDIPIGIIHASSGGTAIRTWIAPSVLIANGIPSPAGSSDGLFWKTMMAPILRAKFRAILWYQGCSDAEKQPDEYKRLMDVLVQDRRDRWGENGDLPFYAVQIGTPGYYDATATFDHYPEPTTTNHLSNYVRPREAQRRWDVSDTGTHGLVTIVDCVKCLDAGDLHPTDKNFVGRRLSLLARRDIYGETSLQAEGPVYTRAVREANGAVRIFFKSGTARGLTAGKMRLTSEVAVSRWMKSDGSIRGFALCGADDVWKDAEATVEGETIVLRAAGIATPTKFHYGYWCITRSSEDEDGQRLNLYNEAGLPMSPVEPQTVEDASSSAKVADPVLLPASCYFSPSTNVEISCATSGATIRYTLDGSEPTATNEAYSTPITLSTTTTVKARAFATNKDPSDIVFATYTLGVPPAPEPDPIWEPGMYKFAEWTPLANNLLAGLTTSYSDQGIYPWNGSVACLTDGVVSSNLTDETVGIGIKDGTTLSWSFAAPKTIEKIRLTACGKVHDYRYDKIRVESVEVLQDGVWNQIGGSVAYNGLSSYGYDQSVYVMLADDVTGRLATNVTGLRMTFGNPNNLGQCRYGEIEASGYDASGEPTPSVATPTFNPAACSFFPSTNVVLACSTLGATIRYTLDGSTPTSLSTAYEAPIALSSTKTIKARAYADGMNPSGIASATYTLVDPGTPDPPDPGDDPTATTNGMWIASSCAPANWTALANNLLAGKSGTISGATAGDSYASRDPALLTDSSVPTAGGTAWIVGFQNNASISWTFETPKTLERVRISCGYLADKSYSGFTVSSVEVQTSGSTEWTTVNTAAGQMAATSQAEILCLVLADGSGAPLAENIGGLRVTFGTPPAGFANYCAEIEAVGTASGTDPLETVATPTFDPAACSFYPSTNVTIDCATAGATIRYTLDGSAPTASSTPYETPIALSATTTIKARAFAEGMEPSAVVSETYTLETPVAPGVAWTTAEFDPSVWSPLENNLLLGRTGTLTGNKSYMTSDITKITDGQIPASNAQVSDTFGFAVNATVDWTFEGTNTLEKIRFTTCYIASHGQYDDIKISKIEVKTSGSDVWTDLGVEPLNYTGTGTAGTALSATLENATTGFLAQNVTALRITFGQQNNVAQYYAEIEAVGTEAGVEPTYDITITAPQNGTLETSVTNDIAAGTTVTVIATAAAGYRLVSVTTNGAALAGTTFAMPAEDVTVAATFEEVVPPPGDKMFYIGDTGYDSWEAAYNAATNGAMIVVGSDAEINLPIGATIEKSVTIDLCGHTLDFTRGWLIGCTVAIVDTGTPAGSGRFEVMSSGLNLSGGTLDLSALASEQVTGHFQMSSTSLLKFPHDRSLAYSTVDISFDGADSAHGVGARIVVRGLTYTWNGTDWGVSFMITSIAVDDEFVELGVLVAPEYGANPTVRILGCETVNGTYHVREDATTDDGALYYVPVSDDRFFTAVLGM